MSRYAPIWPYLNALGAVVLVAFWLLAPSGGFDAGNFHGLDLNDPYRAGWHEEGSFVYSPAFAQVIWPLTLLPIEVFEKAWLAINLMSLTWLVGPFWGAMALALLPVRSDLLTGQVHLMLAVALVISFRWPAAWAMFFLTKVTPGLGVLWHAARGEWRALAIALGSTAAIVAVSVATWPAAWVDWIEVLRVSPDRPAIYILGDTPLVFRLGAAALLVVFAARRSRPAALPFIVLLALPAVWLTAVTLLLAVPRLMALEVAPARPIKLELRRFRSQVAGERAYGQERR